eukprot:scaffold3166_cov111-Isochrysis_galbana.AAC.5
MLARRPIGGSLDEHREVGRRIRRKPEPEVVAHRVRDHLFDNALKCDHPRHVQMAVLKHNPVALLLARGHHPLGVRALPLAKRDGVDFTPFGLGKLQERQHRVHAGRKDEDKRRRVGRVVVGSLQVEGGRLNVLLAELGGAKLGDAGHKLV